MRRETCLGVDTGLRRAKLSERIKYLSPPYRDTWIAQPHLSFIARPVDRPRCKTTAPRILQP